MVHPKKTHTRLYFCSLVNLTFCTRFMLVTELCQHPIHCCMGKSNASEWVLVTLTNSVHSSFFLFFCELSQIFVQVLSCIESRIMHITVIVAVRTPNICTASLTFCFGFNPYKEGMKLSVKLCTKL